MEYTIWHASNCICHGVCNENQGNDMYQEEDPPNHNSFNLIIFYFNKVVIIRLNRVMRDVRIWVFRKSSTQRHRAYPVWLPYTTMESHPWAYPGAPYWFAVPFYPILIGNYGFFPCVPFQNFFFSYYQVWSVNSCYPLLRNWYHNQ